ncbi:MAG: methyltransferase domain-containing protein [Treponema sp.]|jgi:cyclopropane fatty-acyl-phospholipid synthase-like methyltransferase|nr:methyltransferase domain-containing protein [Treponema sp.]
MNKYPLTEKYDTKWVEENWMGPNPLQLLEELCGNMKLSPGMKVLDMGCGKGLTSVFLAKEFGVTVFANDLWIDAAENLQRFEAAGVSDRVFPIHAEAHALPYAKGFFDAAIAIDSYHYYGADESYFPCTFSKLVKPGGQLGIVVPGLAQEFPEGYPPTHKQFWFTPMYDGELFAFHSAAWWRHLWEKTKIAEITSCYDIPDPKGIWYPWAHWADENFKAKFGLESDDIEFLDADTENQIALIAMTAVKKENGE